MISAVEFARRTLLKILVEGDDAPFQPDEYADFYSDLNNYMAALEADGIRLGFTPVTQDSDLITVPPGAIRGMIANMAIEAAAEYGAQVQQGVGRQARDGMKTMRRLGQRKSHTQYPTNLPMGSGNWQQTNRVSEFYGAQVRVRLSLSNNTLPTIFTALNQPTRVVAWWDDQYSTGLLSDIYARVTNESDDSLQVTAKANFKVLGNGDYTFKLFKLDEVVSEATVTLSAGVLSEVTLPQATTRLEAGEWLEVLVEGVSTIASITVQSGQIEVN